MKNTYDKFTDLCSLETQQLIEKFKDDYKSKRIKKLNIYDKYVVDYPQIICNEKNKETFIVNEKDFSVFFAYNNYSNSCAIRYISEKEIDNKHKLSIAFGYNFALDLTFVCFELKKETTEYNLRKDNISTIRYTQEYLKDISITAFEANGLSEQFKKEFSLLNDLTFANILLENYFELNTIRDIILLSYDIDIEKNSVISSIMEINNTNKNQQAFNGIKK